jgi:hypothetical protein
LASSHGFLAQAGPAVEDSGAGVVSRVDLAPVLTGVDLADVAVIGFADAADVKRPRPVVSGGAVVGLVTPWAAG